VFYPPAVTAVEHKFNSACDPDNERPLASRGPESAIGAAGVATPRRESRIDDGLRAWAQALNAPIAAEQKKEPHGAADLAVAAIQGLLNSIRDASRD